MIVFSLNFLKSQSDTFQSDTLDVELDLDALWENTVWEEIEEITEVYGEVEQITTAAGVRGAEAEDEALNHLYYRKSMKRITLTELQKAYGKLKIKRDLIKEKDSNNPKIKKINILLSQLEKKIEKEN